MALSAGFNMNTQTNESAGTNNIDGFQLNKWFLIVLDLSYNRRNEMGLKGQFA